MRKALLTVGMASLIAVVGTAASADSANWSASKQRQMDINRNSDAGRGNGGERNYDWNPNCGGCGKSGWGGSVQGEGGAAEHDPGKSTGKNQVVK